VARGAAPGCVECGANPPVVESGSGNSIDGFDGFGSHPDASHDPRLGDQVLKTGPSGRRRGTLLEDYQPAAGCKYTTDFQPGWAATSSTEHKHEGRCATESKLLSGKGNRLADTIDDCRRQWHGGVCQRGRHSAHRPPRVPRRQTDVTARRKETADRFPGPQAHHQ